MVRGVGDPVGNLVFTALRRVVGCEQRLEGLRLVLHVLDGPLGGGGQ